MELEQDEVTREKGVHCGPFLPHILEVRTNHEPVDSDTNDDIAKGTSRTVLR